MKNYKRKNHFIDSCWNVALREEIILMAEKNDA